VAAVLRRALELQEQRCEEQQQRIRNLEEQFRNAPARSSGAYPTSETRRAEEERLLAERIAVERAGWEQRQEQLSADAEERGQQAQQLCQEELAAERASGEQRLQEQLSVQSATWQQRQEQLAEEWRRIDQERAAQARARIGEEVEQARAQIGNEEAVLGEKRVAEAKEELRRIEEERARQARMRMGEEEARAKAQIREEEAALGAQHVALAEEACRSRLVGELAEAEALIRARCQEELEADAERMEHAEGSRRHLEARFEDELKAELAATEATLAVEMRTESRMEVVAERGRLAAEQQSWRDECERQAEELLRTKAAQAEARLRVEWEQRLAQEVSAQQAELRSRLQARFAAEAMGMEADAQRHLRQEERRCSEAEEQQRRHWQQQGAALEAEEAAAMHRSEVKHAEVQTAEDEQVAPAMSSGPPSAGGSGSALAQLQEEAIAAERRCKERVKTLGGGGDGAYDSQAEELHRLLEAAHRENVGLRDTVRKQQEEIAILEDKVLETLTGLKDGDSTRSRWGGSARSSSMPSSTSRAEHTPSRQPGDIRRLPPQPKLRKAP